MRRAVIPNWLALVLVSSAWLAPAPSEAQQVLVYDSGMFHHATDACSRLGLTCTTAGPADFLTLLRGMTWDLVVVDLPSSEPTEMGWQAELVTLITGGQAVVFTHWNSGSLGGIPAAMQVTIGSGHDAVPFYRWDGAALFSSPESVPDAFADISDLWGTNGFYLTPIAPAYAVAGFTMSPTAGQAGIVIGNSDRTIFNGFLYDDFVGDRDMDTIPDMTELLMNEISFLVGGGGTMGPCMGIMEGAACTAPSGAMGTCRMARCCTGCWDGTACRGGTTGMACGRAGGSCVSCADGVTCTSDVCMAGACSNPAAPASTPCDDGLFCTATDRCSGVAATCVGTGTPCDDGESCTRDTCDESRRECDHMMTSGCFIGGTCIGEGTANPSYPCLVCDPVRNPMDWSTRPVGTACGMASCAAGRTTGAGMCDAMGTCTRPAPMRCPTGRCLDAVSCAPSCTETGCASDEFCDASSGECMLLILDGAACTADSTCASGHCVDGLCCDTVCDGVCEACDLMVRGRCSPIALGADPADECALACDGMRACMMPSDASTMDAGADASLAPDANDTGGTAMDTSVGTDAGSRPPAMRGCGCRASTRDGGWLALSLLALGLVRRTRR